MKCTLAGLILGFYLTEGKPFSRVVVNNLIFPGPPSFVLLLTQLFPSNAKVVQQFDWPKFATNTNELVHKHDIDN